VIGNLKPEKALDNAAYERFTEHGPLALLPIVDHRAAFVWTVAEDKATHVLELDDAAFLQALQASFGYRLGRFSRVGARAAYPLSLSKALRLTATRGVLVGNSAHGLHPVAAQGFNLGMRDVAALCDCIADAQRENSGDVDPGDADLLIRYADWRRNDQTRLVRITDGLVRLFGSSSRPARVLRNIGMLGFDAIPGVRSLFARHMMGLSGRLPRLSRGVPLQ
jgi:2-octaprenyl-6-methoxyphenol hydroxylase